MDRNYKIKRIIALLIALCCFCAFTGPTIGYYEETASANGEIETSMVFTDVEESAWYYEVVTEMAGREMLKGYPDGTFRPNNTITCGEYLTVLYRVLGNDLSKWDDNYQITENSHWAAKSALEAGKVAVGAGIRPTAEILDAPITRKLALRVALASAGITNPYTYTLYEHPFTDLESSSYTIYLNYAVCGYKLGVFSGNEKNEANLEGTLTRAEACKVISLVGALYEQAIAQGETGIQAPKPDVLSTFKYQMIGENTDTFEEELALAMSIFREDLIENYTKKNGQIIVTAEPQSKYTDIRQAISGCYMPNNYRIYIFTDGVISAFHSIVKTTRHEFAHYLWYEVLDGTDKLAVCKSFNSEEKELIADAIGRDYCKTNEREYWAEIAAAYTYDRTKYRIRNVASESLIEVLEKYFGTLDRDVATEATT